jgi:hypothetical protein
MPAKGGDFVPIRWNAKRVKESTNMLEEALNIPELPLYIGQNFMNLIGKIDDSVGGGRFSPEGWIDRYIKRIRENIPAEAVKAVEIREKYGSTQSLV